MTSKKEEQPPRSFQNPLSVQPATDHTIHQSTNLDHAKDVTEFITVGKNVKWNIGRWRITLDTRRTATKKHKIKIIIKKIHIFDFCMISLFARHIFTFSISLFAVLQYYIPLDLLLVIIYISGTCTYIIIYIFNVIYYVLYTLLHISFYGKYNNVFIYI